MQRTALRARKIGTFLKAGIGSTPVPIYGCAAADAHPVGPQTCALVSFQNECLGISTIDDETYYFDQRQDDFLCLRVGALKLSS